MNVPVVITDDDAGTRLDKWLAAPERLGSRKKAASALERGKVFVDDVEQGIRDGRRVLGVGEHVLLWLDRPGTARKPRTRTEEALGDLAIIHEDEDFLVVDKPAGLLTVPTEASPPCEDTVVARLEQWLDQSGRRRVFVVHRIDRGTTGLVVVARHTAAEQSLIGQFRRRESGRRYRAIVHGIPRATEGTWEDRLIDDRKIRIQRPARGNERGVEAIALYRVDERFETASSLCVDLVTGKRNQIRVQAMLRGHPLIGDPLYRGEVAPSTIQFARPALHAARLEFRHPGTGEPLEFESPLPADIDKLVARLRSRSAAE